MSNCRVCHKPMDGRWNRRACVSCSALIEKYVTRPVRIEVAKALRNGSLPPITEMTKCLDCGNQATHYDHRDYFKPLDVDPVCKSCDVKRGSAKNRENVIGAIKRLIEKETCRQKIRKLQNTLKKLTEPTS